MNSFRDLTYFIVGMIGGILLAASLNSANASRINTTVEYAREAVIEQCVATGQFKRNVCTKKLMIVEDTAYQQCMETYLSDKACLNTAHGLVLLIGEKSCDWFNQHTDGKLLPRFCKFYEERKRSMK